MKVGFTGTRFGMTAAQWESVRQILFELKPISGHHGDCMGADSNFHQLLSDLEIRTIVHPPIDDTHRAYCTGADEMRDAKTHFARNRDIVDETDILIACPRETVEQAKGGTWYTYRYAVKKNVPTRLVWPNGRVEVRPAPDKAKGNGL